MMNIPHGHTYILPLHLPLGFPCDYFEQTANILGKENLVILLDFRYPISFKNLFFKNKSDQAVRSIITIIRKDKGIVHFKPFSILPFQHYGLIYKLNVSLGLFQLRLLLWLLKKKVVIWGFHPIMETVLKHFGKTYSIYDCLDLWDEDNMSEWKDQEVKLLKKADKIAFNSKALYEYKIKKYPFIKRKSFVTVCGCDYQTYSRIRLQKVRKSERVNILFMGQINYRMDFALLEYLVRYARNCEFNFYGRINEEYLGSFNPFLKMKNFKYHGEVSKGEIKNILKNADVGIIPYRTNFATVKYSNPMKAYEYLAAGLPVVTTAILPLVKLSKQVIRVTKDKKSFLNEIYRMTNNWNGKKTQMARKIAEQNSWENKIKIIQRHIKYL